MYKEYTWYALLVLLSVSLTSCAFFTVPEEAAVPASFEPISWVRQDHSNYFDSFEKVNQAVRSDEKALKPVTVKSTHWYDINDTNYVFVDKFLHLSDTHIRDEKIYVSSYWKKQLWSADWIKDVTIRSPHIQAFDSLTFTAFLIGAAKLQQDADKKFSFIVHTGDLLDISLITELVESLTAIRAFTENYPNLPIYSMAGNHDGLIWGNIPDKIPDIQGFFDKLGAGHTRGLGVNRTEFVLGHMLADPNSVRGFGFGRNEVLWHYRGEEDLNDLKTSLKTAPKSKQKWFGLVYRQLEDIVDAVEERSKICKKCDVEWLLSYPAVFRNAIHTTGEGDREGLKCGYYSWPHEVKTIDGLKGIRYIALDTRKSLYSSGQMDDIQLGWLYNELAEALICKECVIIFAHHPPDEIESSPFHRMLKEFPNIAAYFYGHVHPTDKYDPEIYDRDKFLLVQTPSLIDFPQTAQEVEVYMSRRINDGNSLDVRFCWRHVRPKGSRKRSEGLLLEAILDTCRRESIKDYNKWALSHWFEAHGDTVDSYQGWVNGNLRADANTVRITFNKSPNSEEIFKGRLDDIVLMRNILGLPPLMSEAPTDCPCKQNKKNAKPKHTDNSKLVEASGLVIQGNKAIVAGDETDDRLWVVDLKNIVRCCELIFPAEKPVLNDIEALAMWDVNHLIAICSQSKTKDKEKKKGEEKGKEKRNRNRLARIKLNRDATKIVSMNVVEDFRSQLLEYLKKENERLLLFKEPDKIVKADPKHGGLNVEGLAVWGKGEDKKLLIGLRSPLTKDGEAVVVSLKNVDAIFDNEELKLDNFDEFWHLPSAGLGIRGMVHDKGRKQILLILGQPDDDLATKIVQWNPESNEITPLEVKEASTEWSMEGIALDQAGQIYVVVDREVPLSGKVLFPLCKK